MNTIGAQPSQPAPAQQPELEDLTARLQRLPQNRPLWLTYTLPWPDQDFARLLAAAPAGPRVYWESSAGGIALVGWGKAAELTDWGERRFHDIQGQAERLATRIFPVNPEAPMDAGPHWIGSFSFQPATGDNLLWQDFPDAYFLLPRVQLTRLKGQTWLTMNLLAPDAQDTQAIEAYFQECLAEVSSLRLVEAAWRSRAADFENSVGTPHAGQDAQKSQVEIHPILSQQEWTGMITGALEKIERGELKKVVLARTMQAAFISAPDPGQLLQALAERYPDCYRFMIEPAPGQFFLGASPELLAEVHAPYFRSSALAGTARRGGTPDEDDRLGEELLASPKERQEHAIVISTIQDSLANLAETVEIAGQPALRKLGNVQHIETAISGRLAPGWGVLDVVAALHPTPALGGWPRQAAQAAIEQAEQVVRGWYAAPVGWFDAWGNGLFAVGIRSGLFKGQDATLFAGAGIVSGSDPAREWRETELKFMPLVQAIRAATGAANGAASEKETADVR